MKNILFFALCIFIASCSKKPETVVTPVALPTPSPTTVTYQFVSNFKADTFKNGLGGIPTDSFYSFKHGDTTGIIYAGTTLYVFCKNGSDTTKSGFTNIYISPVAFDTASAWTSCWFFPYKYYDLGNAKTVTQRANFSIANRSPHFSMAGDGWYWGH